MVLKQTATSLLEMDGMGRGSCSHWNIQILHAGYVKKYKRPQPTQRTNAGLMLHRCDICGSHAAFTLCTIEVHAGVTQDSHGIHVTRKTLNLGKVYSHGSDSTHSNVSLSTILIQ